MKYKKERTIRERYIELLDELVERFGEIMEKQGWWDSDYTLWITEYEAWSPEDMLYIVNDLELLLSRYNPLLNEHEKRSALRNEIEGWIEYNVDVATFGIQYINLKSWLAGAPRVSKVRLEQLKKMKRELDEACEQEQSVYGALYTGSQPEHLRRLKIK